MQVRLFGTLRPFVGAKSVEVQVVPGAPVRTLLDGLVAAHPALADKLFDGHGALQGSIHVLINGRHISFLEGLDTPLHEDDRVAVFPAVGGG